MEPGLQPQMVRPQLYIASVRTELYRDILEQNGITHILQAGAELQPSHPQHFSYLQLPLYDMPEQDIVATFPAAFNFIEAAMHGGGGVLVHCQAGISRSATIVIAYCMWKERLSADAATAVVAAARNVIWPNMGFKCQLQEFEKLGWDASQWQGWNMSRFLSTRYGDDSVDFMSAMLGGAPQDRVSMRRRQSHHHQQLGEVQEQSRDDELLLMSSPFACAGAGTAGHAASGPPPSALPSPRLRRGSSSSTPDGGKQQQQQDADAWDPSMRVRTADQRLSRAASKSPRTAAASPEATGYNCPRHNDTTTGGGGGASPSCPLSAGGCMRAGGGHSTRRLSLACYCSPTAPGAPGAAATGSSPAVGGGGHRLRRHSTGQYALAAAAAGVTALHLGSLKHYPLAAGSRLPEEAALLMAG